jgi:pyruvate dehydrogenase E2 component (dihydrolipoamide acetyltransferase)
MSEVVMPRLSDSMEEGTIVRWLREPGSEVRRGDELVDIETDKATMTYEADADGVLEVVAAEGETLRIGAVIARIGGGEARAATNGAAVGVGRETPGMQAKSSPPRSAREGGRAKASPLARRLAREHAVDLAAIAGSGPGGRILRADVEAASSAAIPASGAASAARTAPPAAEPSAPASRAGVTETGTAKGDVTVQELSRLQQVVARRMAESKSTVPEFTLTTAVDMEACVGLRAQLRASAIDGIPVPSYNDMVVKASALALREVPRANGSYKDGRFELYSRVNVGVAVAADDALVVPTVFDADTRSLGDIARTTRTLAERVRAGQITPSELSGGTFTVSNLGMHGVSAFTAVINPPQAAILAVGAMAQQPAVHDGQITVRHQMAMTLACDHRILYGADAARFLARIRQLLEAPMSLLL